MAEIKIEKKAPVWPWILFGVLLLALVIYLFTRNSDTDTDATTTDTSNVNLSRPAEEQSTDAVSNYVQFIRSGQSMGASHEFTNGALIRLADAIEAKASQTGYTVEADLARVRNISSEIAQNEQALTHANKIKDASSVMADVMYNMQQNKFPSLNSEAQDVKQASNAIKPDTETLQQKDAITNYFNRSADLLQKMN